MSKFTSADLEQFSNQGTSLGQVNDQIQSFIDGFPFMKLVRSATIGDGVIKLTEDSRLRYIEIFNSESGALELLKFVPASGAASRMFKTLFAFMSDNLGGTDQKEVLINDTPVNEFFGEIHSFAFYNSLKGIMLRAGLNIEELLEDGHFAEILEFILTERGLNYGGLPKGLLEFHKYSDHNRTPLEEHLVEGADYARNNERIVKIHFTVSPQHLDLFKSKMEEKRLIFEKDQDVDFEVSYSMQKTSTDTIAVELDNSPFREEDGSLLFRPGGHGALLDNLNDVSADIVFIKNIDNVVPDRLKGDSSEYKRALGGILIEYRNKISEYLNILKSAPESRVDEIANFISSELNTELGSAELSSHLLIKKLDRPLRVCGMVVNTGEPGGGPFWCKNSDGSVSLQIVESSQIDLADENQNEIFKGSTHFNPVDIIASTRRTDGTSYNLMKHRDPLTGFISSKSKDGRDLKAMELPGLWNGSMSDWNTVFVEVPESTFNPVKTANDLLRDQHRA